MEDLMLSSTTETWIFTKSCWLFNTPSYLRSYGFEFRPCSDTERPKCNDSLPHKEREAANVMVEKIEV
jgi:hypothetical protein